MNPRTWISFVGLPLSLLPIHVASAQDVPTAPAPVAVRGAATMTNNGISLLPAFSLGKPAVTYDLSLGGKRLRFEPQFRFALEGTPWSFSFWGRAEVLRAGRFAVNVGANPSLVFRSVPAAARDATSAAMVADRRVATEVAPSYALTEHTSIGMYYMFSRGLDDGVPRKTTNFLTFNVRLTRVPLGGRLRLSIHPQAYFLRMDDEQGYYVTSTTSVRWGDAPLAVESIINWAVTTTIRASKPFDWNVGLRYSFER